SAPAKACGRWTWPRALGGQVVVGPEFPASRVKLAWLAAPDHRGETCALAALSVYPRTKCKPAAVPLFRGLPPAAPALSAIEPGCPAKAAKRRPPARSRGTQTFSAPRRCRRTVRAPRDAWRT